MSYTPELLTQFDSLTQKLSSRNQIARIEARLDIKQFVATHGEDVCDEMFVVLKRRDEKRAWK